MTTKAKPKPKKPGKPGRKAKAAARPAPPPDAPPAAGPVEAVVPLTDLDLTVAKSVRAGTDAEAVARYADRYRAKLDMPRIECAGVRGDPTAPVLVGDGGHRALALMEAGRSSADCLVHWCDTRAEAEAKAWQIAYAGNTAHGLPRTSADLRAAIAAALHREPPKTSDRKLAELLHCHRTPVMRVRYDLTEAGELAGDRSFWAEFRKYKESEYAHWKRGEGKRPEAKPVADAPAARPPEPAAEPGWRGVDLADADLDPKLAKGLAAEGIATAGELADALEDDRAERLLDAFGGDACQTMAALVDELKAERVDPAAPAPEPIDSPWDEPAGTPTAGPGRAATPDAVRDEKGRPVPAPLVPAFAARTALRSLVQRASALLKEAEQVADSPGGGALQLNSLRQDMHGFTRGLSGGLPHVVCPACDGAGKQGPTPCPVCLPQKGAAAGRGWVCRLRYDQLAPEHKAACEGPWPDTDPEG